MGTQRADGSSGEPRPAIRRFTDLRVWVRAHEVFLSILRDASGFPSRTPSLFLTEQTLRSAGSICANIAEGFGRSRRKFVNALDIALGEAQETENWLYKMRDAELLPRDVADERVRSAIGIQKMLTALRSRIATNENAIREASADYAVPMEDAADAPSDN